MPGFVVQTAMTAPTFTEDWFGPASCEALAVLAASTRHLGGAVIEVGCWEGKSTIALAQACAPDQVIAVDTWQGSPGEPSERLAAERDVYATFLANLEAAGASNVVPMRMGWRDYFAQHDEPIRLLHIDAEHSYSEVRDNIAAALPLVVPGGIICGDDWYHPGVQQAVVEALPDVKAIATLWCWRQPADLAVEYERRCAAPSDIFLHLPRMVALVEQTQARHVIELGTRSGVSTIAWLYGLEQTGGRLTSVDRDPRPNIGNWQHWTFCQADDLDPGLVASLDEADVVFIDTSHLYEHTLAELNVYCHLVHPGGFIVCHDTELRRPEGAPHRPAYPVRTAIEEFCATEGLSWTNHPECFGLGVIEVR